MPDELARRCRSLEVLAALGIARVGAPGYEADDVIGTLADPRAAAPSRSSPATGTCSSSSTTRRGVRVLYTGRGVAKLEADRRRGGARPSTGSPAAPTPTSPSCAVTRATGCPGSPGVGAKTAAALINEYGDLAGIRAAVARTVVPKPPLTAAVLKKMHAALGLPRRRTRWSSPSRAPSTCLPSRAPSPAPPADPARAGRAGRGARAGVVARRLGGGPRLAEDALA